MTNCTFKKILVKRMTTMTLKIAKSFNDSYDQDANLCHLQYLLIVDPYSSNQILVKRACKVSGE